MAGPIYSCPVAIAVDRVTAGGAALARGKWAAARAEFEAALAERELPEALEGLGRACWWLDEHRRGLTGA